MDAAGSNSTELGNWMGSKYVASYGARNFTRKDNGLNQYSGWRPYSSTNYDDDLSGCGEPGEANGVLMQDGWITASFNALNQPVGMWSPMYPGGASAQWMWFGYDPLGRCVKRWVGPMVGTPPNQQAPPPSSNPATYYYYDGWNMVQEGGSGNVADRVYVHGGRVDEIVASQVSGVWYNHHYDAQGNCILLSSASDGVQEQYDYDAFGFPYFYNAAGGKGTPHTRFLFTGREWIVDMRLYDYRARQYHPELGRFLQPDPKEFEAGDYNLYRYCHNDPVNKSDPTGLKEQTAGEILKEQIRKAKEAYKEGLRALGRWTKTVGSAARMLGEFASGRGPSENVFDADSVESADMRSDPKFEPAVQKALASRDLTKNVNFGGRGVLSAGLHPTRQFVGSYTVGVQGVQNGDAVFIHNSTNMWSALLHSAESYERPGAGGNTEQIYIMGTVQNH
jgi:RHS repeat-associated protein